MESSISSSISSCSSCCGSVSDCEAVQTEWFHNFRFEQLYEANVESSEMTPGQMLLMGFAGMFSRLDTDFIAVLDAVAAVPITDKYKKADLVREAVMLQVSLVGVLVVFITL